jgi:hypothetical protein
MATRKTGSGKTSTAKTSSKSGQRERGSTSARSTRTSQATGASRRQAPAAQRSSVRKSATAQKKKTAASAKKKTAAKSVSAKSKGACFVISPFGGWHDEYHQKIFCRAIEAAGLSPTRADDLFRSSNIVHDIWHLVVSSRVMLADLTGKNPNVFYELGLAHAARKPVLLVTQSMEDVPFDLRSLRVITYDVEDPSWGEVLRDAIQQGLQETLAAPERSVLPTFLLEEPTNTPKVTPEEKRLLELQQQIDSLRSEVQSTGRRREGGAPDIPSSEAREMVRDLVDLGTPRSVILSRLGRLGVPRAWAMKQIDRALVETGRARSARLTAVDLDDADAIE